MASISSSRSDRPSNCSFAEHVEDLAAERVARLLQLFEQRAIDVAFARFFGDQVPEMADFGLADAVDAAEALFDAGSGSKAGRNSPSGGRAGD